MEDQPKKPFIRRFWWIGLILILLVILIVFFLTRPNKQVQVKISGESDASQNTNSPKVECPKILYVGDGNLHFYADYGGGKKEITADDSTNIHNYCPDVSIQSISESATQQTSTTNSPATRPQASTTSRSTQSPTKPTSSNPSTDSTKKESPTNTTDTLSMITPYVNESDIDWVPEAWSITAITQYWGFAHPGVDFRVTHDIPVQAAASGTIENLAVAKAEGIMGWHAGFCIKHNNTFSVCYNLESFGNTDEVGQQVAANMLVKNGDNVSQGQHIANLVYGGDGAHIDFGVGAFGTRPCPEPYLTAEAKASIMRLIQKTQPTWPMCAQ